MTFRIAALAIAAMLVLPFASRAWADDFTDQLDQSRAAYGKHDLRGAQKALDTAATLLRQQRLVQWKAVLPDASDGWKAENVEGNAVAMAVLGGGVSVSRRYRHGSANITIEIVADSPIVTSMAGMVKMFTTLGAETMVIGDQKAIYRKEDHSLTAILDDKVLATVKGQGATEDDLRGYFKAIRFAEIEKLVK